MLKLATSVAPTATTTKTDRLRVVCGANTQELEGMLGYTVREVRNNLREVMNIGDDHTVILVNGKQLADEGVFLDGNEELEFKKPAGQKG
ncbi:MAG: hypothetical protein A2915_01380 [Candidatus Yanofskybacteria bacterium RIFCSPLOWO2_01_FULL_41_34]|uniref:Ubiquitin-like domain-containing protein n=1 Tax=Candidatus Yanofskybacteria bacterium RIFCSPHIGHO2_01_FULL_41_26 TaxID=1802661 RepID=A0A1F8EBU5_9BACT|nr:MAG: hypothetical protein A2649_01855 [Candidatus Yanofskybacteria bacterium RIFCSPHIGHO2_01_FULL_41_26]OGN21883.1 MAG: hypothetical protein A2915_01380 [Candidatus Yanofskybacteria bacterium RIFCSPLOWO2_01_FULL_41_34]